jgi:hypothetical protein
MSDERDFTRQPRFRLTESGLRALKTRALCQCVLSLRGCDLVCKYCETMYGNLNEMDRDYGRAPLAFRKTARD